MTADLNLLDDEEAAKEGPVHAWLNPVRICAFLLLMTLAAAFCEYFMLHRLKDKRSAVQRELHVIREKRVTLDKKLTGIRRQLSGKERILDFMLGDIRAAEILSELASCAKNGVEIERLEIVPGRAVLSGRAKNAGAISKFTGALRASRIFSSVDELQAEQ